MMENERTAFQEVWKMAEKAGNRKHLLALGNLGDYPPDDPELLLKKLPKLRKIQAAYDNGPGSGSDQGELLKLLRRSPSFRWNDLIGLIRVMKVNHPLHLQLLSFALTDYPSHYQMPVHYILGETDTIAPTSLGKAYFDTIDAPRKTITVIPGAGHNPMYERPDEFATALRAVRETL